MRRAPLMRGLNNISIAIVIKQIIAIIPLIHHTSLVIVVVVVVVVVRSAEQNLGGARQQTRIHRSRPSAAAAAV